MSNYLKQLKTHHRALVVIILMIIGLGLAGQVLAYENYIYIDWFNDYETGLLNGQGGWTGSGWQVQDYSVWEGSKAISCEPPDTCNVSKTGNQSDTGHFVFMVYISSSGNPQNGAKIEVYQGTSKKNDFRIGEYVEGEMRVYGYAPGFAQMGVITTFDEWFPVEFEWENGAPDKWRYRWEDNEWTEWYSSTIAWSYLDKVSVGSTKTGNVNNGYVFVDTIDKEIIELEMSIQGLSPESATEITDLNENITIKYLGFDWEIYDGFIVNFKDDKIGGLGNSQIFLADDLSPTGSGQVEINLQDFGIDSNGSWHLTGLGFGTELDIEGGMFLTTRGYIDFWTNELVSPSYYLAINVEGLPNPYVFTEPNDWYSVYVERFDTPTAFFTAFVGLLSPIFEKIGEFGIRAQSMFDQNEAYERGYSLGEVFPIINGYIGKIDLFFGGFPLASFFKYLILTMFAIFIIRTILKFIPFFG